MEVMVARQTESGRKAGTQWRRFGLVAVPAFLVSGAMVASVAQGALAASFAVAGTSFKLSASRLEAEGMVQYGTVDTGVDGTNHPVAVNGFKSAKLYNLCQTMVIPTPFKDMTVRLTAGSDTVPVTATNLVTDLDVLNGDVVFNGPNIGIDASTASKGPIKGKSGAFALEADSVEINNAEIQAWATTAGTFVLKGLKMSAAFGKDECF
jgi:Family of unknown function (DUF6230)